MGSFRAWRAYRKLPGEWREIVFYAESGQDWHHLEPLVRHLAEALGRKVTYVSSDRKDPGLRYGHTNFRGLCIREGWFLTLHFQFQRAGVVVLTMMELDQLQLKRSINGVHYVYVFHAMGSTHMVDPANAYDAYDSLLCVGPHHVQELRRREDMAGLEPRHLVEYGYPRLEQLMALAQDAANGEAVDSHTAEAGTGDPPVVLVAPTWGENSLLNRCGEALLTALLGAGHRVILRPHYQTRKRTPKVVERLLDAFGHAENFEFIERMGENESLLRSDVLVCDWSSMAIEYALGLEKPVLFVDVPRRVRNPDYEDWALEPLEVSIRKQVGEVLAPENIDRAPEAIVGLLARREELRGEVRRLRRELVFNLGGCVPVGAEAIARLADAARAKREAALNVEPGQRG